MDPNMRHAIDKMLNKSKDAPTMCSETYREHVTALIEALDGPAKKPAPAAKPKSRNIFGV
tara:strand:+ start:1138 stop:1317 length:180 start_codon:yes stop_codon:yes gene_type:complete